MLPMDVVVALNGEHPWTEYMEDLELDDEDDEDEEDLDLRIESALNMMLSAFLECVAREARQRRRRRKNDARANTTPNGAAA